jgi:hypothetical protein
MNFWDNISREWRNHQTSTTPMIEFGNLKENSPKIRGEKITDFKFTP